MKIISLNTWGGRAGSKKLIDFFKEYSDVDIFCLQEIWSAPYEHLEGVSAGGLSINHDNIMVHGLQEISEALSNHSPYFRPHHLENYGLLILIKKEIKVTQEGDVFVYKERGYIPEGDVGNHARNIQYITFDTNSGPITVINFHGLWNGQGKTDTEDRILQSQNIINFLKELKTPYIFSGDFNLLPETRSLKMFEDIGLKDLIKENNITSTRTSFYDKEDKFADYTFISKDILVNDFKVLPDVVSDHSPLFIDFDVV